MWWIRYCLVLAYGLPQLWLRSPRRARTRFRRMFSSSASPVSIPARGPCQVSTGGSREP